MRAFQSFQSMFDLDMTPGPTFPTRSFEQCHRFFNALFQLMCKDKGDEAKGLTRLSEQREGFNHS